MKVINPKPDLEERTIKSHYPFDSKEHTVIAETLRSYGIPFFYKQPTLVMEDGQRTVEYVDFFLPTYNGLAVDYVINQQSKIYLHKQDVYKNNQIPAVLLTRRDVYDKNFQGTLYKKLERTYRRRPVYSSAGSYR